MILMVKTTVLMPWPSVRDVAWLVAIPGKIRLRGMQAGEEKGPAAKTLNLHEMRRCDAAHRVIKIQSEEKRS